MEYQALPNHTKATLARVRNTRHRRIERLVTALIEEGAEVRMRPSGWAEVVDQDGTVVYRTQCLTDRQRAGV